MSELEVIYDEHVNKVYKYFYINCFDKQTAEDLTSQTFIAFIDKAQDKDIEDNTKYLYGIMRNVWTTYLRLKYRDRLQSVEDIEDFESYSNETINQYESADLKTRAEKYIKKLPKQQQQVARMRFLEEMTLKEIAAQLNKNMSYVKTTQNRAIKSIQNLLNEPGGIVT